MRSITLELNSFENGQTVRFKRWLQNRFLLRELGLSYKEIEEKLGFEARLTAETGYQRFSRTNCYAAKKLSWPAKKTNRKRAETNRTKKRKGQKNNIRTNASKALQATAQQVSCLCITLFLKGTRQERVRSAPYLRLKKLNLFKIAKGGTLWVF